jgi:phosphate transport system protein
MAISSGKVHTSSEFENELNELRRLILELGAKTELMTAKSLESLTKRDSDIAQKVIKQDIEVNQLEVDVNELCMQMMALRQPTSIDLRFITTGLKIASDLERVGDLAVNLSERALELNEEPPLKRYIELPRMAEVSSRMLRESLDSFLNEDVELARKVIQDDDEVDDMNEELFRELLTYMLDDPRNIGRATRLTFISKYLERVADHATNIAEAVIFMVEGSNPRRNP